MEVSSGPSALHCLVGLQSLEGHPPTHTIAPCGLRRGHWKSHPDSNFSCTFQKPFYNRDEVLGEPSGRRMAPPLLLSAHGWTRNKAIGPTQTGTAGGPGPRKVRGVRLAPRCHGDGSPALHTGGRALGGAGGPADGPHRSVGSGGRPVHSGSSALALGSGGKGGLRLLLERDREVKLFLWHGQFLE